jgi:hypothetical protein
MAIYALSYDSDKHYYSMTLFFNALSWILSRGINSCPTHINNLVLHRSIYGLKLRLKAFKFSKWEWLHHFVIRLRNWEIVCISIQRYWILALRVILLFWLYGTQFKWITLFEYTFNIKSTYKEAYWLPWSWKLTSIHIFKNIIVCNNYHMSGKFLSKFNHISQSH